MLNYIALLDTPKPSSELHFLPTHDPRPTTAPCPPHRQRGVRDNGPVFFCGAHPEASRLFIAPWVELRGIGRRYFAAAVGVVLELGLRAVNSWTKSKSPATTAVLYQGVHIVLQP